MASFGLLEIFVTLLIICFIVILGYLSKNKDGVPTNWPIVGMLPALLVQVYPDIHIYEGVTKILLKAQCNFLIQGPSFSNMKMLITADPANVHYILSSNFHKGPDFKSIFDLFGNGIFNSDSDQWRDQRKTAMLLITHRHFHKLLATTTTNRVQNGLFSVLNDASEKRSIVDLQDVFQRFSFDCTCKLVTGFDSGCLSTDFPDIPFAVAVDDAQQAIFYRNMLPKSVWKLQRYLRVGNEKKLSKAKKTVDLIIEKYIMEKKQNMPNENEEETDLLASYINLGFEDDRYLRDMVLNMLVAGRDTIASALTWFFWNLSQYPYVEKKIREEISSVDQDSDNFTNKLVYSHASICESLRLYPPVPWIYRHAIKPDILPSGHHVEPSTQTIISIYAMGRMPSIWGEDCLEFRPDRWITDKGRLKHEPAHKFLVFNAGPRTCPGKEMSFTQMKIAIVNIIQMFDIQVVKGQDVKPGLEIALHMKNGLKVQVAKKSVSSH